MDVCRIFQYVYLHQFLPHMYISILSLAISSCHNPNYKSKWENSDYSVPQHVRRLKTVIRVCIYMLQTLASHHTLKLHTIAMYVFIHCSLYFPVSAMATHYWSTCTLLNKIFCICFCRFTVILKLSTVNTKFKNSVTFFRSVYYDLLEMQYAWCTALTM